MLRKAYASAQVRIAFVVAVVIIAVLAIAPTVIVLADGVGGGG